MQQADLLALSQERSGHRHAQTGDELPDRHHEEAELGPGPFLHLQERSAIAAQPASETEAARHRTRTTVSVKLACAEMVSCSDYCKMQLLAELCKPHDLHDVVRHPRRQRPRVVEIEPEARPYPGR